MGQYGGNLLYVFVVGVIQFVDWEMVVFDMLDYVGLNQFGGWVDYVVDEVFGWQCCYYYVVWIGIVYWCVCVFFVMFLEVLEWDVVLYCYDYVGG